MNFYYCDACHYCFESKLLPDRCPDCGAVMFGEKSAVRPATENEKTELLRIRAEDNDRSIAPTPRWGYFYEAQLVLTNFHL